jgi:hypothetical protein
MKSKLAVKAELYSLLDLIYQVLVNNGGETLESAKKRMETDYWRYPVLKTLRAGELGEEPENPILIIQKFIEAMERSKSATPDWETRLSWIPFIAVQKKCEEFIKKQVVEKLNVNERTN